MLILKSELQLFFGGMCHLCISDIKACLKNDSWNIYNRIRLFDESVWKLPVCKQIIPNQLNMNEQV